jgi:hypothetical protein
MCAAGSFDVNGFGYPALMLKITAFLLSGVWLIINFTDNKASDYPLIRIKYGLLVSIAPFLIAETLVQGTYLIRLKPDVITSCCGTIFSSDATTLVSDLISFPRSASEAAFYTSGIMTILTGLFFYWKRVRRLFFLHHDTNEFSDRHRCPHFPSLASIFMNSPPITARSASCTRNMVM